MQISKTIWLLLVGVLWATAQPHAQPSKVEEGCFERHESGVVHDTCTGLEWFPGPDHPVSWKEARDWVAGLEGGNWRMPTEAELGTLHRIGNGVSNIAPVFDNSGYWIWAGAAEETASRWIFRFSYGGEGWSGRPHPQGGRAFAVRDRQKKATGD